jgi:hypothetical protein
MSGKYALIIGNTEYADPGLAQLTAPGKDANDFARVLRDPEICAFDDVKVLLNQPSSLVIEAIDEFFDQRKPDDLLVLYFSGHGVRDELGILYLAVKNSNRFRLRSTAIKSDFVREGMDQGRSKRQVLILDCCNSGAFAQGTKAATGVSIGTASAFEAGYGRIILTASDSTQFAWEGNQVIGDTENSLFTHFLVQGLEGEADLDGDGNITVDELYDYAYEKVKLVTPKQTPSKFSSKQQGEIVMRQIRQNEQIRPLSLPDQLISEIENPYPEVRLRAVQQLTRLLTGNNLGLARSATEALQRIVEADDSRQVSHAATQALESVRRNDRDSHQKAEEVGPTEEQVRTRLGEEQVENAQGTPDRTVNRSRTAVSRRYILPAAIALIVCLTSSIAGYYMLQNRLAKSTVTSSPSDASPTIITPTFTRQPSQTAQPTLAAMPESIVSIAVTQANLYKGPALEYGFVDPHAYKRGEKITILARNSSGLWLLGRASDGKEGWLYIEWIDLTIDLMTIPMAATIPPLPATPTRHSNEENCNPPPDCGGGSYDPNTCQCT